MPRFLDTRTGQFVWIEDPSTRRYAILSHTWKPASEGGEQSYMDVCRIQAEVADKLRMSSLQGHSRDAATRPSILSHPQLSSKIKDICRVAREAGYDLVWVDSCCIDKSNGQEVSDALRSMYDWYKRADVCYAYLHDVPPDADPAVSPEFHESDWHVRGWTLQELVAPKRIVFLASTWEVIGTREGLAVTLERITGVDSAIMTGRAPPDAFSVVQRLSWVARRRTTLVEDEAYCLMGIFGVHVYPSYGEGRAAAFVRLWKEIIKAIPHQSIHSWGHCCIFRSPTTTPVVGARCQHDRPQRTAVLLIQVLRVELTMVKILSAGLSIGLAKARGEQIRAITLASHIRATRGYASESAPSDIVTSLSYIRESWRRPGRTWVSFGRGLVGAKKRKSMIGWAKGKQQRGEGRRLAVAQREERRAVTGRGPQGDGGREASRRRLALEGVAWRGEKLEPEVLGYERASIR